MKALILAAGYGTRLAAVAKDTPKPLLDVAGMPLIDYTVAKLKKIPGLDEIVVVTNNKFFGCFVDWSKKHAGIKIRVVNDGTNSPEERLGSVGDMDFVWRQEKAADDWLVIGGDNIFVEDINHFVSQACAKKDAVSIGLYDIKDIAGASKFGVAAVDHAHRVTSFEEKPAKPKSSLIVMLLYYFPKSALSYIQEYRASSQALDAAGSYIQWLSQKKNVYGFQFSGKWYDIGSIESLREAQAYFSANGGSV